MSSELDDIGAVFDEVVNQFTDPMAFYRELIQNSIDAGSQQIDVWFETEVTADDRTLLIAHIDDFGVGMTQEIIDSKLTRLFSSTKDDDFTKIGRFGIGFVSVFSVEPDVVVVDTARDGEAWRVIFHPDRTYDLIRLDEPIEGTQIRVIKTMSHQEAKDFQVRAESVIKAWCRYVSVPILVDGEDIREPFEVSSEFSVVFEEEGTRIVAGFVEGRGSLDFYNRGLTLMEGATHWPGVSVKIDSRYLEHTLTRDRVLEDRHYQKAMTLVRDLVEQQLPAALLNQLEETAASPGTDDELSYDLLMKFLVSALCNQLIDSSDLKKRKLIPLLGGATPITVKAAANQIGSRRFFLLGEGQHLLTEDADFLVMGVRATDSVRHFWQLLTGDDVPYVASKFVRPREVDVSLVEGAAPLMNRLRKLLEALNLVPNWIGYGDLRYARCPMSTTVAIGTPNALKSVLLENITATFETNLGVSNHVVINVFEPRVMTYVKLATVEPEFAAMQLFKSMVADGGISGPVADTALRFTHHSRQQRLEGN